MSNLNFQINPCAACLKHYGIKDLNSINDCCSTTAAAFAGVSGINNIRNLPDFQNCIQCVNDSIHALGTDECDMRITSSVPWIEVPNLYPNLLQQTQNKAHALAQCQQQCLQSKYPQECIQRCNIQNDAVVELFKQQDKKPKVSTPSRVKKTMTSNQKIQFWVAFILAFGVLFFFIYFFVKMF